MQQQYKSVSVSVWLGAAESSREGSGRTQGAILRDLEVVLRVFKLDRNTVRIVFDKYHFVV